MASQSYLRSFHDRTVKLPEWYFIRVLLKHVDVKGKNTAPIYKFLKSSKPVLFEVSFKPNFSEFLDDKEGNVVHHYASTTPPLSIEEDIKKLSARNITSDPPSAFQLWEELRNLEQERGESISSFHAKMKAIWDELALFEIEYCDKERLFQFLKALTDDFEPCRASLLDQSPLPTLDDALSRLLSDETRLGLLKPQRDNTVAAGINKFPPSKRGQKHECSLVECHKCKQKGHFAPNCTIGLPQRFDEWKTQSKPGQSSKPVVAVAAAVANEDTSVHPSIGSLETFNAQVISSSSTPTALPISPSYLYWLIDSGCYNHMTSNPNFFSTLTRTTTMPPVRAANGSLMEVRAYGDVLTSDLYLPETLQVPDLTGNIISVGQLCDSGFKVMFSIDGCYVRTPQGDIQKIGDKVGRLFYRASQPNVTVF